MKKNTLSIISSDPIFNVNDIEKYSLNCKNKDNLLFIPVADDPINSYKKEFYKKFNSLEEYLIYLEYTYNKELDQYGNWINPNAKFNEYTLLNNILINKNGKTDTTLQIKDIDFQKSLLNLSNNKKLEYFSTYAVILNNNWHENKRSDWRGSILKEEVQNWDKNFYNKFLKENQNQFLTIAYCSI